MTTITPTSSAYNIGTLIQTASGVTSTTPAGVAGMLETSRSSTSTSSSSNMFTALSGGSDSTGLTNIFDVLNPGGAGSSIASILQQQKVATQTNKIFTAVAQRLTALQSGQVQPSADWEKIAAYGMQTGQPVAVSLDSKGQVQAAPQAQADLSKFNAAQQRTLTTTMADIATMAAKITANKTNQGLIDKLNGAENDLNGVYTGALDAQASTPNNWEQQGVQMMRLKKPFLISLDAQGNLQVQDQAVTTNTSLSMDQQVVLRTAAQNLPKILGSNGLITQQWQADASSFAANGIPYHLEIDKTVRDYSPKTDAYGWPVDQNGQRSVVSGLPSARNNGTPLIKAVENSGANITPAFLNDTPYPDIGANTPALKQAATLIQAGKPFFLDFDKGGHVVVKEATAQNLITYNTPAGSTASLGSGSVLSVTA